MQTNPLIWLWNFVGTIGGIISLSSMVENWSEDLVKWKGFIALIIDSYRSIIEPVWDLLVGWLPWTVPYWVADYLVFGVIIYGSLAKAMTESPDWYLEDLFPRHSFRAIILVCLAWPFVLAMYIAAAVGKIPLGFYELSYGGEDIRNASIRVLQWFGAIIFGLVILLAINAQM